MNNVWAPVEEKAVHPLIRDRILSLRANGEPSWVLASTYATVSSRKTRRASGKEKSDDI
jgi:hypothetical protein